MQGNRQANKAIIQRRPLLSAGALISNGQNKTYIVEGILGQGGFSSVYLVRDQLTEQHRFALKEICTPDTYEQFDLTFEAEVLMRLQHPSLPHIYEIFTDTACRRTYLLMDYIAGKDLETLRTEQARQCYPLILVIVLMSPIVEAISYLHAQQPPIVHRDIKPANIIVPDTGRDAFLVDFGLAKEYIKDKTTNILRGGTPGYAAPEQYGQGTSPQTDIYGLAATLYTLLTGTVPPPAITRCFNKQGKDPLKRASELNPAIPAAIDITLTRALNLQIEQRYASVEDFWKEFTMAAELYAMGGNNATALPLITTATPAPALKQPTTPPPAQPITPLPTRTAIIPPQSALASPTPQSRRSTSPIVAWSLLGLIALSIVFAGLSWPIAGLHDSPSTLPNRHLTSLALTDSCTPSQDGATNTDSQLIEHCASPNTPALTPTSSIPSVATPSPAIYATPEAINPTAATTHYSTSAASLTPVSATPTSSTTPTITPTPTTATPTPTPADATPTAAVATATPTPASNHSSPIISIQLPLLP